LSDTTKMERHISMKLPEGLDEWFIETWTGLT
jgi:hypothetical protein